MTGAASASATASAARPSSDAGGGVGNGVALRPGWFYFVFAASGFAGLIYESVWTRYLKLFLGHAALAQALVLAIFLFGLAAGAAGASRLSRQTPRPLLAYAAIEALVALAAVWFHDIYIAATDWALDSAAPALGGEGVEILKWALAAALILPQSLLLGATFPLMSAGLVRLRPRRPGGIVAMLYFSNSFGAALGVLASGFALIPVLGLPGAAAFAGFVNIAVAAAVWAMDRRREPAPPLEEVRDDSGSDSRTDSGTDSDFGSDSKTEVASGAASGSDSPFAAILSSRKNLTVVILAAAALTGFASLVYEIVWVRMLSLLLGSSAHSFELMLSAFILGLAIGGLAVRRRTDRASDPLAFLGWVQIAMAALAIASLLLYPLLFHVLAKALQLLPKTDAGYAGLLAFSFVVANAMMLPTTICAGMTLPLLTRKLMSAGGERAVGMVYAANTFGAIAAVCVAGNVLTPALGIKGAFLVGALTDLALGLALFVVAAPMLLRRAAPLALAAVVAGSAANLNPLALSSGVFRSERFNPDRLAETRRIVFHRDGRTASVTVYENVRGVAKRNDKKQDGENSDSHSDSHPAPNSNPDSNSNFNSGSVSPASRRPTRVILTNGKPDASLFLSPLPDGAFPPMTGDEMTMVLSGLLPLLAKPDAKRAANIGFGSGLTTRALLLSPLLERVDTVEIEEMMVQGVRELGPRVAPVFGDPRSRVVAADAKTFFAAAPEKYDVIVSEPSNPWVGGIAGLFTREFYRRARKALADDGVFAQWMHLYENNPLIFASVAAALASEFSDYRMYLSGVGDVLFIAVPRGKVPPLRGDIFSVPEAREFFSAYRLPSADAAELLFLGDRARMEPYFASFRAPANSDYFPYLENNAPRAFFIRGRYVLSDLPLLPIPLRETLFEMSPPSGEVLRSPVSNLLAAASDSRALAASLDARDGAFANRIAELSADSCAGGERPKYLEKVTGLLSRLGPFWSGDEMIRAWGKLEEVECVAELLSDPAPESGGYLRFWRAFTTRDDAMAVRLAAEIAPVVDYRAASGQIVLLAAMTSRYRLGHWAETLRMASLMPSVADAASRHAARLLAANAAEKMRR